MSLHGVWLNHACSRRLPESNRCRAAQGRSHVTTPRHHGALKASSHLTVLSPVSHSPEPSIQSRRLFKPNPLPWEGRVNVGSLFSGIGGLDYGLHRAGHRHVFFCEADPWRREVLAARWPGAEEGAA